MAETKITYGTHTHLAVTSWATLASHATNGAESAVVDNTSNLYSDVLIFVEATIGSGTPANDQCAYVYAYGSEDGSTYSDNNIDGTDKAVTPAEEKNMHLLGVLVIDHASSHSHRIFGLAAAFGGIVPRKWGLFIRNYSGQSFTAADASYTGITYTTA